MPDVGVKKEKKDILRTRIRKIRRKGPIMDDEDSDRVNRENITGWLNSALKDKADRELITLTNSTYGQEFCDASKKGNPTIFCPYNRGEPCTPQCAAIWEAEDRVMCQRETWLVIGQRKRQSEGETE
jgi:hypothetical protein